MDASNEQYSLCKHIMVNKQNHVNVCRYHERDKQNAHYHVLAEQAHWNIFNPWCKIFRENIPNSAPWSQDWWTDIRQETSRNTVYGETLDATTAHSVLYSCLCDTASSFSLMRKSWRGGVDGCTNGSPTRPWIGLLWPKSSSSWYKFCVEIV